MSTSHYYVPHQSRWPILASAALFSLAAGAGFWMNASTAGKPVTLGVSLVAIGMLMLLSIISGWFANVIEESQRGLYSSQMDRSFRWGMSWFIFSEVMFFAAFFGALFYVRMLAVPWLGGEGDKGISHLLWPEFVAQWPLMITPDNAQFAGPRAVIDPWHLPLINTLLLVSSSVTLTLAHHALQLSKRPAVIGWLLVTVTLGAFFLILQAEEYIEAYTELGLTLQAGVYGATFFMLTGFHGLHVTLGAIILTVILVRVIKGHFDAHNHFAFEAAVWYWHFVDVVWIGLFLFVYVF